MFDQEEKPENREEPKTIEEQVKDLKADLDYLRQRVSSLEDDVKGMKESLRKMSFTPGL
jgi:uncharacterized coiled-coil DUF342 family protein